MTEEEAKAEIERLQEVEKTFMELKPDHWTWAAWLQALRNFKNGKMTMIGADGGEDI